MSSEESERAKCNMVVVGHDRAEVDECMVEPVGDSVETKVKLITDKEVKGVKKGGGHGIFRSNREHVRYSSTDAKVKQRQGGIIS